MANPTLIAPDDLCRLVGVKIDDPAVANLRDRLGTCEEANSSDGPSWQFDRDGVWLSFRASFGNRLQMIYLFGSKAEENVRKYKHPLPAGLKLRMHCDDVQRLLSPPIHTDRWEQDYHPFRDLVLSLGYDDHDRLNKVILMLPESAAELGASMPAATSREQPADNQSVPSRAIRRKVPERSSETVEQEFRREIASTHKVLSRGRPTLNLEACCFALCTNHLISAMILWRRGESPVQDIESGLEAAHAYLKHLGEGRARQELFHQFAFPQLLLYAATGRFDSQLDAVMIRASDKPTSEGGFVPFLTVTADAALMDAIGGNDAGLLRLMASIPEHDRTQFARWWRGYGQVCAAGKTGDNDTFQKAFDAAERSFLKRPAEREIEETDFSEGGGWQNTYVIDYRLAALLRWYETAHGRVPWETMHRAPV